MIIQLEAEEQQHKPHLLAVAARAAASSAAQVAADDEAARSEFAGRGDVGVSGCRVLAPPKPKAMSAAWAHDGIQMTAMDLVFARTAQAKAEWITEQRAWHSLLHKKRKQECTPPTDGGLACKAAYKRWIHASDAQDRWLAKEDSPD